MSTDGRTRVTHNPFVVLGLAPDATRAEAERQASLLLGQLALGLAAARRYRSPLGEHERTPDDVRQAIAALRDPTRRVLAEVWAATPAETLPAPDAPDAPPAAWPDALVALGLAPPPRGAP